jgi:hypothetical protein
LSENNLDCGKEELNRFLKRFALTSQQANSGIERLIPGGGKGRVRLRPLGPGRYTFLGEFHEGTAQGAVMAE